MSTLSRSAVTDGLFWSLMWPYWAEQLSAHPSMTLKEVQAWLASEQGLSVSLSCVDKFLRQQLGYRYKKTVVASEQKREDTATTREQWQAWQQSSDWSKLIFLDETGLSTDMIRRYSRALGGERSSRSHWQTLTFIAALRADRIMPPPWCVDQAMNGEAFKE
jgi:hypothetical protein